MDEHIHTGFVTFVTVGVYAVLFIWLMRFAASWLVTTGFGPAETAGKAIGGVVHFGG